MHGARVVVSTLLEYCHFDFIGVKDFAIFMLRNTPAGVAGEFLMSCYSYRLVNKNKKEESTSCWPAEHAYTQPKEYRR